MLDLWRTKWHCDKFSRCALVLRHQLLTRSSVTDATESQQLIAWLKNATQNVPTTVSVCNYCTLRYAIRWHVVDKGKGEVNNAISQTWRLSQFEEQAPPGGLTARYSKRSDRSESGIYAEWRDRRINRLKIVYCYQPLIFTYFYSTQTVSPRRSASFAHRT
jgi:hypothetical protein